MLGYNKMFYYRTLLECRKELLKKYIDKIWFNDRKYKDNN